MKALILKDIYVLWKQMRVFMLVILLMAMVNNTFNAIFLVIWCSMLPYTAMAYDEQSHWDRLAAMMPYRKRDIVLSKYVLGWLCIGVISLFCLVMQTVIGFWSGKTTTIPTLLVGIAVAILSLDLTLPMILRFGVERGRMIFLVFMFAAAIGVSVLVDGTNNLPTISTAAAGSILVAASVILTVISVMVSMKLYETR